MIDFYRSDQTKMYCQLIFCVLIIFGNLDLAEAVKCHECVDTDNNGWCQKTFCEGNFCFKANATMSAGHRHLQLGCISTGIGEHGNDVGCERGDPLNTEIQDISSQFCVCNTNLCNAVPKPTNSASKLGSFRFELWPGLMSFFTFSMIVHFCNQLSL